MPDKILRFDADFHAGSPVALFPNHKLNLKAGDLSPSTWQSRIYRQWAESLDRVAELRKPKFLGRKPEVHCIIVGDLVEGIHHQSKEVVSPYLLDHRAIFVELWDGQDGARERMDVNSTYVIEGTLCHAGEDEDEIAAVLNAVRYSPNSYTWPALKCEVNGVLIWSAHHGPASGGTENAAGNALRNKLKDTLDMCLARGERPPRVMVWADKHVKRHEVYQRGQYTIDGFLLPSWKLKDRFVYKVSPMSVSNIGCLLMHIPENGDLLGGPLKQGWWEWSTVDVVQDERITI